MKRESDQLEFSKKLKRVKVLDPAVAKAITRIAGGDKHVVLRGADDAEVVAMSLEEYESLIETLDVLNDPDTLKALREGEADLKAGRAYSHEEVFGHRVAEAPTE